MGPQHPHSSDIGNPKHRCRMVNSGEILEFGPYRLDLGRRLLTRDAQTVTLQPKTFELLVLLAGRQGEALSKDTLMEALAGHIRSGGESDFSGLRLRKALGEPAAHWIESASKAWLQVRDAGHVRSGKRLRGGVNGRGHSPWRHCCWPQSGSW
jgi:hypothetical protein